MNDVNDSQQRRAAAATGVVLINMGTPDEATPRALRRYLKEFLWDRRVVDVARPLWWLILNGVILNTRPWRSAALYRRIWTEEGSPLLAIGRRQAAGVERLLRERQMNGQLSRPVHVALGMRYGRPSVAQALDELCAKDCGRILALPLYPQYSAATTASAFDAVTDALRGWPHLPDLRFVSHYHDHPAYIDALVATIGEAWAERGASGRPDRLLFSFHGLPERSLAAGDPYFHQCRATAGRVAEKLGLAEGEWLTAFQSRMGRGQWLQPYTDEILRQWGGSGVGRVDVVCPGFAADCLETLEEIARRGRETFLGAGGSEYHYIPALNDRPVSVAALSDIVAAQLSGWPGA